jgi:hypothetical protein
MRLASLTLRFLVPEMAAFHRKLILTRNLKAGGQTKMNRRILGFCVVTLIVIVGAANAQTSAQAGTQAGANGSASAQADKSGVKASGASSENGSVQAGKNSADIANGTTMNATLSHPVDAKKNKTGDEVIAKTTEAVKSDGKVIIPKGSTLKGHVTQASARSAGNSESALGITFDRVVMSGGREMPCNFTIQAISAAETMASSSSSFGDGALSSGGSAGGGMGGSGRTSGGGLLGGVGSTAGGTVGTTTGTAGNIGSTANGTVKSATNLSSNAGGAVTGTTRGATGGLNSAGQLTSNSQGVFGLNGLNLQSAAAGSTNAQGTLITSADRNVHLDSGTRMLLAAQGQVTKQ